MALLSAAAPFLPQVIGGIGAYKASSKTMRPSKAPAIPMPDEEALQRSRRKSTGSRGRASTILTGTDDGLGG